MTMMRYHHTKRGEGGGRKGGRERGRVSASLQPAGDGMISSWWGGGGKGKYVVERKLNCSICYRTHPTVLNWRPAI